VTEMCHSKQTDPICCPWPFLCTSW
jgi:hypothetical protein